MSKSTNDISVECIEDGMSELYDYARGCYTVGSGSDVGILVCENNANPLQLVLHYDDGWRLILISDTRFTSCVLSCANGLVTVCVREAEIDQMPEEKIRRFNVPKGAKIKFLFGDSDS